MKTHNQLILIIFGICLIVTCDVISPEMQSQDRLMPSKAETFGAYEEGIVSKPFKAKFFTVINPEEVGLNEEECPTPPFIFFNVQEGSGEATHLGKFTTRITFCVDITDLLDDGTLTGDESAPYNNGKGVFTAANGDELFFDTSGAVVPSDNPDFDFEFQDPFIFTGGTGRFAGASGGGMTDSFVDQSTNITDHKWVGNLEVPKP